MQRVMPTTDDESQIGERARLAELIQIMGRHGLNGLALRLGLRQIDGIGEEMAERLVLARGEGYPDIETLARRSRLPAAVLTRLAEADAFGSMGLDRRAAAWAVRRLPDDAALPLFQAIVARSWFQPLAAEMRARTATAVSSTSLTVQPVARAVATTFANGTGVAQTTFLSTPGVPVHTVSGLRCRNSARVSTVVLAALHPPGVMPAT